MDCFCCITGCLLKHLPSDLYALYESMLTMGPSHDKQRSFLLFQWTVFAQEPLSIQDALPIILNQEDFEPRFMCSIYKEDLENETEHTTHSRELIQPTINTQVRNLSKGLIEIVPGHSKDTVHVIHHSVKDYLINGGFSFLGALMNTEGYCHFALSQSCLEYLNMPEIRNEILGESPSDTVSLQGDTVEVPSIKYTSWLDVVPEHVAARAQFRSKSSTWPFRTKDRSWNQSHRRGGDLILGVEPIPNPTEKASIEWGENSQMIVPHVYAAWTLIQSSTNKISNITRRKLKEWAFYRIAWRFPFFHLAVSECIYHARLAQACEPEKYDWKTFNTIFDLAADILSTSFKIRNHIKIEQHIWKTSSLARRTGVHIAAANGLHSSMLWFCKETFPIDAKDCYGQTALHIALCRGYKDIVDLLLSFDSVNIFAVDADGDTLLHAAIAGGLVSVIPHLLARGLLVDKRNGALRTPLHEAANLHSVPSMTILLDAGADIMAEDFEGKTPFDEVMNNRYWRRQPLYSSDYGEEYLRWNSSLRDSLQLLVARGADTNRRPRDDAYGTTKSWLEGVLKYLYFEIAELLLKGGANIDEEDESGATLLLKFLKQPPEFNEYDDVDDYKVILPAVLKFMLLHGADIHRTLPNGSGVLLLATRLQSNQQVKEVILLLLEQGANPNVKDEMGATILYTFVSRLFNHVRWPRTHSIRWADGKEILTSLIRYGAEVTVRDTGHYEPVQNVVRHDDDISISSIRENEGQYTVHYEPAQVFLGYGHDTDARSIGDDEGDVFSLIVSHAKDFLVDPNVMQWSTDDNQALLMEDAYVAGIYLDIIALFLDAGAIVDLDESKYQDLFSVARKYARIDLVDRIKEQSSVTRLEQGLITEPESHQMPRRARSSSI